MRDSADCVSSGRLREVKNNCKFKKSSLKVVAYERWSLTRGGRKGRFDCISDDVIGGSTKAAQHSIENKSRNIKAVFFQTWQQQCTS